ncbi:LapA family protein [Parerythrobacter lacustris]|uniref:DUF1049 domain-containing protein n=1 Tax=Parerythrobacter lacustris TaxID=2969984 RepID=A0ABT1XSG1_9SPHN|nr:LapA family protein [Parerythrobacter lacustris]MCR2834578.1 DUF1049 domain-containing protein [Parerythrobacter lacustris]
MQIVRTILWVLLAVALLGFSFLNWKPVEVHIWDNLVLETKVPALVILSFLIGIVPMWLLHRGTKWRLERRIKSLENAFKANSVSAQRTGESPGGSAPAAPGDPAKSDLTPQ